MNWSEGWQAGFVLGAAFCLGLEALGRAVVFRIRHRLHGHCLACKGCLANDGRAVAAIEKLVVCPDCGDTIPLQHAEEEP